MPKRISKPKRPRDVNQLAHHLVELSTEPSSIIEPVPPPAAHVVSLVMAEMGRKGGRIGGKRRLETMAPGERKTIAQKAAAARWAKQKNK